MWSYAPRPGPAQLAASPAEYPENVSRYLSLSGARLPAFGVSSRNAAVERLISAPYHQDLAQYRRVWEQARVLTRGASTPYDVTLAVERWFRSGGGFTYDEEPPRSADQLPPLADFVLRGKRGYCQHFAGAMALMLRFLGVPARVAVGFTGGSRRDGVWRVTDHDAHAWVEVWFDGWGWLPFDPTPGRGTLSQTYTTASDSAAAALRLGGRPFIPQDPGSGLPGEPATATRANDSRGVWVGAALAGALVSAIAALGLVKVARRQRRYWTDDPRRLASAARADLADRLRDQGLSLPARASLEDVTRALRPLGLTGSRFAAAAARARYGPADDAPASARDARRELRSLLRALRSSLPLRRRVRGYLSLRSLRAS